MDTLEQEGGEFYKSSTVDKAQKGIDNAPQPVKVQNIDDYNKVKEEEQKKKDAEE